MTAPTLSDIRALLAEARPGPWWYGSPDTDATPPAATEWLASCLRDPAARATDLNMVWMADPDDPDRTLVVAMTGDGPQSAANAALIWAMSAYVRHLIEVFYGDDEVTR